MIIRSETESDIEATAAITKTAFATLAIYHDPCEGDSHGQVWEEGIGKGRAGDARTEEGGGSIRKDGYEPYYGTLRTDPNETVAHNIELQPKSAG